MDMTRRSTLALAVAASLVPSLARGVATKLPEGAHRLEPTQLAMTIGADGRAQAVECVSENAKRLCAMLTRAVSSWTFEPGKREGAPTAVDVFMDLTMVAVPQSSGFAVQAVDAELSLRGPTEQAITPFVPPTYPPQSQIRGETGTVDLEVTIEPGRPTYRVGRLWFNGEGVSNRRRNLLVAAAARAAELQPVRSPPPELVSECVQYVFTLQPGPDPGVPDKACKDAYVPGFTPPALLTRVAEATF